MRKNRKLIFAILAILIAVIIWGIDLYASTPRLPQWEKEKVEEAYYAVSPAPPLIWYDENGYTEEKFVYRYIGTYDYCHAFLEIGDNTNAIFEEIDLPYPICGLSRTVYYPVEADVVLYHTKKAFTYEEVSNYEDAGKVEGTYRLCYLASLKNRREWLTDAQLERLTQNIEKIAKAHN